MEKCYYNGKMIIASEVYKDFAFEQKIREAGRNNELHCCNPNCNSKIIYNYGGNINSTTYTTDTSSLFIFKTSFEDLDIFNTQNFSDIFNIEFQKFIQERKNQDSLIKSYYKSKNYLSCSEILYYFNEYFNSNSLREQAAEKIYNGFNDEETKKNIIKVCNDIKQNNPDYFIKIKYQFQSILKIYDD